MSAVPSLLRVMTLRDAEAMVLEAGKVPTLRRRGQVEQLAMPALDGQHLADFATPLLSGRSVDEGPALVAFHDPGGGHYQVTIEKTAAGLRIVVRPGRPPSTSSATAATHRAAGATGSAPGATATAPAGMATARGASATAAGAPGAMATTPGAMATTPGAMATTPGAMATTPGAMATTPGAMATAPGAMAAALGAMTSASGAMTSASGAAATALAAATAASHADAIAASRAAIEASRAAIEDGLARLAALLSPIIAIARDRGASDAIVSMGTARMRIDGQLESLDLHVDDDELAAIVGALGSSTDHSLELHGTRLRVNLFDHLGGAALVARLIRDRVPSLADLGLPPELASVIEQRDGLVLVCGPTGSGKSTTLAALIDKLDQRRAAHVITLEDPIEYRFTSRRGVIHQRELGTHIPSFAAGLRSALREAPDVILLGELRDRETIAAALTAADTGHLVLATLHAPSAAGAIDRIIDAFPDGQRQIRWQLAAVLRTVITQYLLPRRDGGRVAAVELVPVTTAVTNLMRKGDLQMLASAIQTGRDAGMIPLERSLARLLESGVVSPQVVKKIAADHDLLAALTATGALSR